MKRLLLDIETAPNLAYVWRMFKYTIPIDHMAEPGYTLCWAAKWYKVPGVIFSGLNKDSNEKMLYHIWSLLDEADAVIHYNGTKFDIPVLNTGFASIGLTPPTPFKQIDLYRVVKRNFSLPSYKLDYVLKYFGLGEKVKHKGMSLWTGCMEGDKKSWAVMERYNKGDVSPLEKLYTFLLPWIKDHPNFGLYVDTTRPVCTNCGSHKVKKNGVEKGKTQAYQRYKCTNCGTPLRGRYTITDKDQRQNILTQA